MLRDTTSARLAPEQRFNHYPATPLCTLTWWFEGSGETLEPGSEASLFSPRTAPAANILLTGPQTRPTVTWNPGPARGMMLLLMPDALHQLVGLDVPQWIDRTAPAGDALPADWLTMCQAVLSAKDESTGLQIIEAFLAARWSAARAGLPSPRYREWAEALAVRAATTQAGRSLRQIERRIRTWAGQPLRELRGFGRAERAFFDGLAAADAGKLQWSAVAVDAGYFDQPHMNRASRRITGLAPEELRRRIAEDEGFWAYRVWQ
jgi:AraC-like DNA-binding protein